MKRTFRFDAGMDISVTIEVDLDVLTPAMATEINDFWSFGEEVLDESDGDVIVAAARRAAPRLISSLLDGTTAEYAIKEMCESEGWPPQDQLGMRILSFDLPDLDTLSLDCTELGGSK